MRGGIAFQCHTCLFFFSIFQGKGYQNLIDRSHLYEPTWKGNENVTSFCIEMCPQILPSSDMKPVLEWMLLCILNYKSCNLHKPDNHSQLMLKHISSLQAISLKKKNWRAAISTKNSAFHPFHDLVHTRAERRGILCFWVENKTYYMKSTAFHWDTSKILHNSSSHPSWLFFS